MLLEPTREASGNRAHFEQCLLSPCVNFRLTCPRARYCVPYNCEDRGCSPVYYDADYSALPADKCRVHFFEKGNTILSEGHSVADRRTGVRLGLDLPVYYAPHEAEKPGTCPGETEDIIRICVAECAADRDCSGRSKCCWNGCVHRCAKPQAAENGPNYLNLPLISDDD
ncbi:activated macrophage/microglia WAP domain protein precursor [Aphelenchoides avenae]|nr:activated macrophage/microglia WAP domain protein precursor [Aphelenchus avenae]